MPEGVIVGGWNYVIAAYAVLFVVLTVFGASLVMRSRRLSRQAGGESSEQAP